MPFLLIVLIVLPSLAVSVHAASAPDLTVDSIWLEDASQVGQPISQVSPGQSFNIVATIKNIGQETASGYYLDVYYDSDYGRGGPDNIAPGEVQTWYVGPLTAQAGTHTTKWVVDPDNQIAELDETNNQKELAFTVGSTTETTRRAGLSQPYLLGFKVTDVHSDSHTGDFPILTTSWSSSGAEVQITLAQGESLFLVGTAQVWNDLANVGSSIAICRDGVQISGDMLAAGATITNRELGTVAAVDTPSAGTYTYALSGKTNVGGKAWVSQPYLLAFKVSNPYSNYHAGNFQVSTTSWSSSGAEFQVTVDGGESLFLIGVAQLWNDYATIGSSIAVCRDGVRISGDMFAAGATETNRELATAVAVDAPSAGTHTYSLSAKTDPGGVARGSEPYLIAFRVSDVYSKSRTGDFYISTTRWSSTGTEFQVTLGAGESLFLIGTAQVWNDYANIGSSMAICRDQTRASGDMFAAGATITHRELATAVALETPAPGHTRTRCPEKPIDGHSRLSRLLD